MDNSSQNNKETSPATNRLNTGTNVSDSDGLVRVDGSQMMIAYGVKGDIERAC